MIYKKLTGERRKKKTYGEKVTQAIVETFRRWTNELPEKVLDNDWLNMKYGWDQQNFVLDAISKILDSFL